MPLITEIVLNNLKNLYSLSGKDFFKENNSILGSHGCFLILHEIIGLENLPDSGPALLIYYHGAMPIDFYYVYSKTLLYKNRKMKIIADKFLFKIPGLGSLLEAFEVTPGTKDQCVSLLNKGHILSISPGGVREALFSDHNYEVIWGTRAGFAQVALEAKCVRIHLNLFCFGFFDL